MIMPAVSLGIAIVAGIAAIALALIAFAAFRAWIGLKRLELSYGTAAPPVAERIEVADLKERIRRLEAIAAGVEL